MRFFLTWGKSVKIALGKLAKLSEINWLNHDYNQQHQIILKRNHSSSRKVSFPLRKFSHFLYFSQEKPERKRKITVLCAWIESESGKIVQKTTSLIHENERKFLNKENPNFSSPFKELTKRIRLRIRKKIIEIRNLTLLTYWCLSLSLSLFPLPLLLYFRS